MAHIPDRTSFSRPTATMPLSHLLRSFLASLSPLQAIGETPTLIHSLQQQQSSILSVVADARYIYTGSQDAGISVRRVQSSR